MLYECVWDKAVNFPAEADRSHGAAKHTASPVEQGSSSTTRHNDAATSSAAPMHIINTCTCSATPSTSSGATHASHRPPATTQPPTLTAATQTCSSITMSIPPELMAALQTSQQQQSAGAEVLSFKAGMYKLLTSYKRTPAVLTCANEALLVPRYTQMSNCSVPPGTMLTSRSIPLAPR